MWQLNHKEGWVLKNWCFWTVVLEKTLESLLDSKEIKPVNPKGNEPWIFVGRTDAEAEAPYFGHLMEQIHWKRPRCWERLRIGEGGNRGWDGWMISLTQWTWVWPNSRRWWRTGKPCSAWGHKVHRTQLSHWTTTTKKGHRNGRGL